MGLHFRTLLLIPLILFLIFFGGALLAPKFMNRAKLGEHLAKFGLFLETPLHRTSEFLIRDIMVTTKPEVYGNEPSKTLEILKRNVEITLGLTETPMTAFLGLAGGFLEYFSDVITERNYTHIKGKALVNPKPLNEINFITLNACMFFGGLPLLYGGVRPADERVQDLSELLIKKDPDFIFMQEVAFGPALSLIEKLENRYSDFYTRIGPNPWKCETCLFVASKIPLLSNPKFIPFPFHTLMKRGIFYMETQDFWALTTHLEEGDDEKSLNLRELEIAQLVKTIAELKEKSNKPCFVFGDLNIPRTGSDSDEYSRLEVKNYFFDAYAKKYPLLNEVSATCSNLLQYYAFGLKPKEVVWEIIDYALLDKDSEKQYHLEVNPIDETLNLNSPSDSLSDHRGLHLKAHKT